MPPALPEFLAPMLAKIGEPFDSDEHLFEIKWDGTRGLAFREVDELRMLNRRRRPMLERYPELDVLEGLQPGLVLDGEVVMFQNGQPDFQLMLRREQARTPRRAAELAAQFPATFVVFDLLYRGFESVMDATLDSRRELLERVVDALDCPSVVLSEGITGAGKAYFEEASRRELEGVVAKRRKGRYETGKRSGSWVKIKRRISYYCVIVGYLEEQGDLRSLLVAMDVDGELTYAGRVGSGLSEAHRQKLQPALKARRRESPLIPCPEKAQWVEPGLFCTVSCAEWHPGRLFRAPVFLGLVE